MDKGLMVKELVAYYAAGNISHFAERLGVRPQTISTWIARKTFDTELIFAKCENVSAEWLLSGSGEMLKRVVGEEGGYVLRAIPIADISAAAGCSGYQNGDYVESDNAIQLPQVLLKRNSVYYAIRVKGESMVPTILDSSFLIIRLLDRNEWGEMPNEQVFVISDNDGKAYVKRLRNRLAKGFVVCTSDNPDKYNYPNFNLQQNEINTIWHVEWLLSAKMPNIHQSYYAQLGEMQDDIDLLKQNMENLLKRVR